MKRFVAIADSHGQLRDIETIETARDFATWFRPDLLIHMGDNWDLRAFRMGASDDDKAFHPKEDFEAAEDTLDRFYGAYASAQKVYLQGNHDHRRLHRLQHSPRVEMQIAVEALLDEMNSVLKRFCDLSLPYDKRHGIFEYEGFRFVHGYSHGIHAVRKHAGVYGSGMMGHIHCFGTHVFEDVDASTFHSMGCACALDQPYNDNHITALRQENGFAYGFLEDGFQEVHFAKKRPDGSFHLPTEWNE